MRFIFVRSLFFASVFLLLFASVGSTAEINMNQLDALARTCIKLIQNGDFRGAAMLYHYPANYSAAELETDMAGVEKSLKIFVEEFGTFNQVTPLAEQKLNVNIFASGGTRKYWDQHKDDFKIKMETNFSNFGPGFLIVHLVDIVGAPEIKAIAFGLPVSGESVGRIRQVGEHMVPLMKARQKSQNKDKL